LADEYLEKWVIGFGNQLPLVIAEQPTTARDVTIRRDILDLLREQTQKWAP